MDRERLQQEGHLAVKKQEAKRLQYVIKGLLDSVRLSLDPLEKIEDLEIDVAFQEMAELAKAWAEYKEIMEEIKAANKILGRK